MMLRRILFSIMIHIYLMFDTSGLKIGGNQSLSDCTKGKMIQGYLPDSYFENSDLYITTPALLRKWGFPSEEHLILTEDGYYLTLHRIPGKPGAPPVLLQHGAWFTSFDWIVNGPSKALGLILYNRGYDVWLGNARGNTYSLCHVNYTKFENRYWNFSFHEMGIYDLPAVITYITEETQQNVIYVGHSMGNTMSYIMAAEKPDIASKVKAMFGLSPVAYISLKYSTLALGVHIPHILQAISKTTGINNVLPQTPFIKRSLRFLCNPTKIQKSICAALIFLLVGFDYPQLDSDNFPLLLSHTPAGLALKSGLHFYQIVRNNIFSQFDYGTDKNLLYYNSSMPPGYNISNIKIPVGLLWSDNDAILSEENVQHLYRQLPNGILNYRVKYEKFNHIDFLWGIDANKLVYPVLLSTMEKFK
ncbi:hypothetical protein QAD02_016078 [Eretmocerus hayati]|uniref:Uncharacterized protein n=1 Tax=Eretmocerus hayati TaxID=131215 RepID=A0ACC2PBV7_9HYME|nr:hypothetical protein QAD02_016078 [Eretmocerus hayati]